MKTNETVAEIVSETKVDIDYGNGVLLDLSGKQVVGIFDRIEAAHKREVAELRECLKEAVELICDTYCESDNCDCCARNTKWRKVLDGKEAK